MTGESGDVNTAVAPTDDQEAREYRYPGSSPFADTEVDRLTFFGRGEEIDAVVHSILSFDLFLVYAISGVGKTSLLTAGVLPKLRERDLFPVIVRLNDPTMSPVELIDAQIRQAGDRFERITVSRHPSMRESVPSTLWDLLASLEVWRDNTLQPLVLIFDQFEELFTLDWSDDDRQHFIAQLGEVLRRHRTQTPSPEGDDAVALPAPNVKFVLIIREDSLGELEALATDVPQVMHHRFRLDGLSPVQAGEAIRAPALLTDPRLATARFGYTDGAGQAILQFLRAREDRGRAVLGKSIDPSQLQIILQHVERSILPGKLAATNDLSVVEITESDLGGKTGLDRILRDFYRNELAALPPKVRQQVQHLCESGLINQNGRRLSLEEGEIAVDFHVTKSTLEHLVDRRLLRAEPRVGSIYYELAHDTLAAPILSYRDDERSARRRRRRWWAAAAAAVLLVGLGVAVGLARPRSDSGDEGSITIGSNGEGVAVVLDMPGDEPFGLVRPPSDDDVKVKLMSADSTVEIIDDGGAGYPEQWLLDDSAQGRYTVVVSGRPGAEVDVLTGPVRAAPVGETTTGRIDGSGDLETFEVTATVGGPFVVEAVPDSGLDPVLEVFEVDRFQRADFATQGDPEAVVVDSRPSPIRVVVSAFGSSSGGYALSVRPAEISELAFGDAAAGAIDVENIVAVYEVDVPGDGPLVVEVQPDDGLDALLEVIDPNGVVHQSLERGAGIETVLIEAPAAGRYRAVVRGSYSSGTFDLIAGPAPEWLVRALAASAQEPRS